MTQARSHLRICAKNNREKLLAKINLKVGKLRFKIQILEDYLTQIIVDHRNEEGQQKEVEKEAKRASSSHAKKTQIYPMVNNLKNSKPKEGTTSWNKEFR